MVAIGRGFWGRQDFREFAEFVQKDLRYVRDRKAQLFLDDVLSSCTSRVQPIEAGRSFWRARLGKAPFAGSVTNDMPFSWVDGAPWGGNDMKPIPNWHSENRANPRGIPYLYLATDKDTAMSEVRPWIGSTISVALFTTARNLNVIDCSRHHDVESYLKLIDDLNLTREDGIWVAIDRAFATPVNREEEPADYIPTQIIAETFKSAGYDGIVYKSLLSDEGYNLALFSSDDAKYEYAELFTVDSVRFNFKPE